jgi:hydroxyacylglutathione hydrolase
MALPDDTLIYCGHEYSLTNAEFATEIEPSNVALLQRFEQIKELHRAGKPTLPVSLATERATNPFLRPDSDEIQHSVGLPGHSLEEVFAAIRERRNKF